MDDEVRGRLKADLKKLGILLIIGVLYAIWCNITGLGIPCIFNLLFKIKCPGCGMTHADSDTAYPGDKVYQNGKQKDQYSGDSAVIIDVCGHHSIRNITQSSGTDAGVYHRDLTAGTAV